MPMALKAPQFRDGVPGGRLVGGLEVDRDRAGVVQDPDDVGATRGRVRGGSEETSSGAR